MIDEQVEKLKSRGCVIGNEENCRCTLENVSYYRLSAYFLPFITPDNRYVDGTSFEKIFRIYSFDRKLRSLLFSAIEEIEISLRARFSYYHSQKYGPLGYLSPDNFNNAHNPEKFAASIAREIESNSKTPFVRHHLDKYDGKFPLWAVSELFTFGMLSYFYNDLVTQDKKAIFGRAYKDAGGWLRCCTDLRNICAHYGRLYYRIFSAKPSGISADEREKSRLWGAILVVKALYPSKPRWNSEVVPAISALIEEYKEDISLYHIAFPDDWEEKIKN